MKDYLLLILSHKKSKVRDSQHQHILKTNKHFEFKYFIGDPTLDSDYKIDGDIVYLKCLDNYESLPRKVYAALTFIDKNYPDIKGIVKTDDDIDLDLDLLYQTIQTHQDSDYFGLYIRCHEHMSKYHFNKCEDQNLNKLKMRVPNCEYAAGGGYFIPKRHFHKLLEGVKFYYGTIYEDVATGLAMNQFNIAPDRVDIKNGGCYWQ